MGNKVLFARVSSSWDSKQSGVASYSSETKISDVSTGVVVIDMKEDVV